ncbi:hypothetical protein PFISCL1PPCAC_16788, partial [Pristionchus fissidentatus]
ILFLLSVAPSSDGIGLDIITVINTVIELRSSNAQFNDIWIQVDRMNWKTDKDFNRQFILDMMDQTKAMRLTPGIFTNQTVWERAVGKDWRGVSQYRLWWKSEGKRTISGWIPFGGWILPYMRQYARDVAV